MNLSRLADRWQGASPEVLSVLRFMAAFLYIEYGFSKLIQYPPTTIHFTPGILTTIAGPLEVICGALLLVGLFSRLAAIVVVGEMVVAYYHVHRLPHPARVGPPRRAHRRRLRPRRALGRFRVRDSRTRPHASGRPRRGRRALLRLWRTHRSSRVRSASTYVGVTPRWL